VLPRPCVTRYARVNKFAEACFERNWYSVPTRWAHRDAIIEVYETRLRIVVGTEVVAEHRRGFGVGERFGSSHYVTLLAHKHRAAENALVLSDGRIPEVLLVYSSGIAKPTQGARRSVGPKSSRCSPTRRSPNLHKSYARLARGTDDPAAIALMLDRSERRGDAGSERGAAAGIGSVRPLRAGFEGVATAQLMEARRERVAAIEMQLRNMTCRLCSQLPPTSWRPCRTLPYLSDLICSNRPNSGERRASAHHRRPLPHDQDD